MTNESAWNVAKSIKAFLADAFEKGNHRNQTFRKVTRKQLVTQADINDLVYLTPEELTAVRDLDLSKDERLARVRDLFVFLCFTGLRFSDSQQVCPEHRRGNTLRFTTGKNRKTVTVPLSPVAVAILDAYEGTLPQISNQKANEYLTEVLEEADIIEPVQIVRYRGTERVERTKRKCDVVGMHGAKRTFVTLGLLRGASAEALAKVTGNTVKTLRTYDVRTAEDAAEEVRQVWSE